MRQGTPDPASREGAVALDGVSAARQSRDAAVPSATSANASSGTGGGEWKELDLLRGLAVVAMVLNHAAAGWYPGPLPREALAEAMFGLGAVAPVLFFFATGFGTGLQRGRSRVVSHRYGLARKVVILLLADQLMAWRWSREPVLALDFLGFIAISMLVLEPLRRARRPVLWAALGMTAVLLVRFVVGPLLAPDLPSALDAAGGEASDWLGAVTGRLAVPGISYPLFPWLVFPLLGFVLGFAAQRAREGSGVRWGASAAALVAVAAAGSALAAWLAGLGYPVNRYGVMSAAYFPLSLAAIALAGLLVIGLRPWLGGSRLLAWLSLRGVASLAAVPIHLALVRLVVIYALPEREALAYATSVLAVVAATLAASHAFSAAAPKIVRLASPMAVWVGLSLGACVCGWVMVGAERPSITLLALAPSVGQLCLCALLVAPAPAWSRSGRVSRDDGASAA